MIGPVPLENINNHFNRIRDNNNNSMNNNTMNATNSNDDDDDSIDNMDDIELTPTLPTIANLSNSTNPTTTRPPLPTVTPITANNNPLNLNTLPRRNRELWIEHERRQRTIRFLMMFLMMLILMDGEQAANEELKKKHHDAYLRKKKSSTDTDGSSGSSSRTNNATLLVMDDYGNLVSTSELQKMHGTSWSQTPTGYFNNTIPKELYTQRKKLDDLIYSTYTSPNSMYYDSNTIIHAMTENRGTSKKQRKMKLKHHPRIQHLFELNNHTDEESKIWAWADEELKQSLSKKNEESKEDTILEVDKKEEKESELKRKVYHYPRNATGHFRGYWTRVIPSTSPTTASTVSSSSITKVPGKTNSPSTTKEEPNETNPITIQTLTKPSQVKDTILHTKRTFPITDAIGIFILPQDTQMYGNEQEQLDLFTSDDDTVAPFANVENKIANSYFQSQQRRVHTDRTVNKRNNDTDSKLLTNTYYPNTIEPLYITETEGKLHFHFYSRALAGMKEMSLIDGYMKIRDINDLGFTNAKRHLFVRVHGVYMHSIGRISLVANESVFRSALVIFDNNQSGGASGRGTTSSSSSNGRKKVEGNLDDVDVSIVDTDSSDSSNSSTGDGLHSSTTITTPDSNERRKLHESIMELSQQSFTTSSTNTFQEQIIDIRNRALLVYSEFFHLTNVGGDGWNLFTSNDDDFEANEEQLLLESLKFQNAIDMQDKGGSRRRLFSEEEIENSDQVEEESINKENKSTQHWAETTTLPYPYAPYNKNVTKTSNSALLKKTISNIPEVLFNNDCEFEINLNVNETQWSVSEWRDMAKRIVFGINYVNPFAAKAHSNGENRNDIIDEELVGISPYIQSHDEALVMYLSGTMESSNCDFAMHVNATAFRTDWEQVKYKATIYSVYMMLASLAQIIVLLRQLIHAQNRMATKVSMLCIGWQTVLDAILCFEHVMLCLMVPPVSTAFFMVALFKFLLFYVIEMKYMVMIMEARSSAEGLPNTASELRRRLAKLQFRFFSALFVAIVSFWYLIFGAYQRKLVFIIMYSFWVPQILYNIFTESKRPLHKHYIYGNSITRLNLPLILFAIPNNFMQEIEPEFPLDFQLCVMLIVWVGIQTALLIGQGKYGARFMIPARFLPPKYDYSRPIPRNLIPQQIPSTRIHSSSDDSDDLALLENDVINETGTRNRKEKRSRSGESATIITVHEENEERPTIDCVICHNPIDITDRSEYMIAPCDHIFHKSCLEQWMDVKMECPICRTNLPGL